MAASCGRPSGFQAEEERGEGGRSRDTACVMPPGLGLDGAEGMSIRHGAEWEMFPEPGGATGRGDVGGGGE